jgi:hypothetical protein
VFLAGENESQRMFSYSLEGVAKTELTRLLPIDALGISPALTHEDAAGFDPAKITAVQIQGDGTAARVCTWPAAKFYVDLGNWPPMNEYTVHQTLGPVRYYWGYLAAQGAPE